MTGSVLMLEFNELSPTLVDQFIAEGRLPNFKRLRDQSVVFVSDAEEEGDTLEPWIQWVTVHTGLSYARHKVFDLDDGPKFKHPRIWDLASAEGRKVWICGSMNAAIGDDGVDGLVLPDPWATSVKASPEALFDPYLSLVRTYVQEYTSSRPPVGLKGYFDFAMFMLRNGLSPRTIVPAVGQLAKERFSPVHWRRATILDRLQWDVFRHHYRRLKPGLSTFFLNSTAHLQHYYWRNMAPDLFSVKPDAEAQKIYGDAILYGYQAMDAVIGEAMDLAGPETSLILCTALSQQPLLKWEHLGGKQLFKPVQPQALMRFAGVDTGYVYAPVMAEEFHLFCSDETAAIDIETKLGALRMADGSDVMRLRRQGSEIFGGCAVFAPPAKGTLVTSRLSNQSIPFEDLFYAVDGVKSGMHHPDGIFWVKTPKAAPAVIQRKLSLREIAPTVLALCGVRGGSFELSSAPEVVGAVPEAAAA